MARMIRKQVYLEPVQDQDVKRRARILGITEAEVIRKAIEGQLALLTSSCRDLDAWEREKAFIAKRMAAGSSTATHRFRREDAYHTET